MSSPALLLLPTHPPLGTWVPFSLPATGTNDTNFLMITPSWMTQSPSKIFTPNYFVSYR